MATPAPAADRRPLAVAGLALSLALLLPGILLPVLTVRGHLDPKGVAGLAPQMLEAGLSDTAIATIRPLLNPLMLPLFDAAPGGIKGALVSRLGAQLGARLGSGPPIEVYHQTRSILGSVRYLYRVGSPTAATLILLFSVLVPFTKAALVLWAVWHRDPALRRRTLHFVELIAKWSMADVFAVALFIAYLAARASQSPSAAGAASIVSFTATFGPGFYCFAAYCLVSLATQQATARWIRGEPSAQPLPIELGPM
jgi:paraquat-inducible protein A